MKYALYIPNYGVFGDARVLADLAKEAEDAGWDGFFLWDHIAQRDEEHGHTENLVDPWVALSAVAMNTSTIRIGTTVTPLPRRRPWKLARETVSLDRLSNGRLILGVGIGLGEMEWHDLGEETDQRMRGKMLDEGLDVLTGLWSGEPFSFEGDHYHLKDAHFLPKPLQTPRIPIWVGGFWPKKGPFRRMARWDGMFPIYLTSGPEMMKDLKESVDFVQNQRNAAGLHGPFDVAVTGVSPGGDLEKVKVQVNDAAAAGTSWWLELLMPVVFGFSSGDDAALDVIRKRIRQGMPRV
jgi:probable F420-dependent oxidoreductase